MPPPPAAIPVGTDLKNRLAALRRRLRFVATFRGSAWLAAVVLSVLLVGGALDWWFHLPALVRGVILTGLLTGAGIIVYRLLFVPLSQPTDDLSLALRVEERFPSLNDALATTMQFLERGEVNAPPGESPTMRRETVKRAVGRATGIDFLRVVDSRGLRVAGVCAMFSALPVLVLLLLDPITTGTAFARLLLPFSDVEWPKKTKIKLDSPPSRIGRNREYRVTGEVLGVMPKPPNAQSPPEATLELTHEGLQAPQYRKIAITVDEDNPKRGTFVMTLRPNEVHRNFRFRILANDAATPEHKVEVLTLPVLVPLDGKASPQVSLDFPEYTDLPSPHELPKGSGNLDVIAGTVVTLEAKADRPLKRAWIEYQPETAGAVHATALAFLGAPRNPVGVLSSLVMGASVYAPVEAIVGSRDPDGKAGIRKLLERYGVKVKADRRLPHPIDESHFVVVFRPIIHGNYQIHFEDNNELVNQRQYELRLKPDPAPSVRMDRPSTTRDMLAHVLATADLPLQVVVEDPQFAVRYVWLEYRIQNEPTRFRMLYDHSKGIAAEAVPLAGSAALMAPPVEKLRLQRLVFERTFPLRSIRHANGAPLKEGDKIVLQALADDFDDVTVNKEPGRSPTVEITIVGRPELEKELDKKQAEMQQELQRLHEKQKAAIQKVAEAEARMRKGGKMVPEREAMAAEENAKKAKDEAKEEEAKAEEAKDPAEKKKHQEKAKELTKKAEEEAKKAEELRKQTQQVAEAAELQQQINRKVGDEKDGLRAEVDRLQQTLKQNNMEKSAAMDRLKKIQNELDRLAERELPQIEPRLQSAQKAEQLQDEQTRKERQADLAQKAKQAEQMAQAEEEKAKQLEEKAAKAEQEAAKAESAPEAAKKQADARNLSKQAEQAKKRAQEKMAEAEQAKKEAAQPPDPMKARRELAEARRNQEEVEKSLGELLRDLEPWSNTKELRDEANRLKEEQKALEAKAEELEQKVRGKKPEELAHEEKAELDELKDAQKRVGKRAEQLLEKMERMAEEQADKDPKTARDLKEAAKEARDAGLNKKMKEAEEKIGENKLNEARQKQREARAEMEKLANNLEKDREDELDRLAKKQREAEKRVGELMDEQERLQKKIREAEKIKDPKKREEELKRLAKKQKELKERTEEELKRLQLTKSGRARQALQQAAEEMGQAGKQLDEGKADDEKQDDVLDRLDEAREELKKARKEAEDELAREQIARVADVIRRIRDRQEALGEESKRIQELVQAKKNWERGLKASTLALKDNQKGLGDETDSVAKKDLTNAPVFQRLLQRVSRNMNKAGDRFGELVTDVPAPDKLPDAEAADQQKRAMEGLRQLLESLKEQAENPRPLARKQDQDGEGGDGGGGGGGGGGGDNSLPPSAQLKLLRLMQKEAYDRTAEFQKKNPDPAKLTDKQKAELREIEREQKEVADLLDQLTRPPGEGMDDKAEKDEKEGDKK